MAEKRSIHEFTTGTPQALTSFLVDNPDSHSASGYTTEKVIASDLGNTLLGTLNYTQALETDSKNIFGAINELKEGGGGNADKVELTQAEYDELSEEEKHNGKLYFITDGQAGGGGSVDFVEESIPDIPERELPYYPSGEYSALNTTDKHIVGAINEVKDSLNIEGVVIKTGNPEVRYWKYGKLLIVSLVCGTYAYTSETVIGILPENLRPIRGNRVYLPNNGVFGVDTNGEIWARNIPQYTIITNIVFLG